jgi:hypothetical protein
MTIEEIQAGIRQLPIADARYLSAFLEKYLADCEANEAGTDRSWLELKGVAADSTNGVDAQEWVNQMRDEWNDRENQLC